MRERVGQRFFAGSTVEVAARLLGCTLTYRDCAGVIVEVEAYAGDAASHFVTRPRTGAIMGEGSGQVYVYRIYGVHLCLNFTTDAHGPGAVLLRALEPVAGLDAMRERRGVERVEDLCSGPGRLAQALGVTADLTGRRVTDVFQLARPAGAVAHVTGPRIGISVAKELPWRFVVQGTRFASRGPGGSGPSRAPSRRKTP